MNKLLLILAIILIVLPAGWFLIGKGYFNMHDDLQVMRIYQMDKCFADGQIPCRWSPDMVYGYGQAMFNYYSVFPYYVGELIRLTLGLSIMATVKLLFLLSLLVSAIGMYLLARHFWGIWGGILSATLYVYAPYHALDVFVRGALAESFALSVLPFLWLGFYKLIKNPSLNYVCMTSISLFVLLTSHNISSLIYAPFTILWVIFWLVYTKNWKYIKYILLSGILGIGLSSFFLLPAIVEQNLIQVEYLIKDYSDYHAHFVTLNQLFFKRRWGFGPSIFGPYDDLSFQIGWPHWWLSIPLVCLAGYLLLKKKTEKGFLIIGLIFLFLFSAFLTHSKSLFIWEKIQALKFVQFPWRFLSLAIFYISFAGGGISLIKFKYSKVLAALILVLIVGMNINYFVPFNFSRNVTDKDKLTGVGYELQQKAAILDYLPKTAQQAPPGEVFPEPKIVLGQGTISSFNKQSNRFSFDADIYEKAQVVIPTMYFPGWIVIVDNVKVQNFTYGAHGVLSINLDKGRHIIRGRFTNTPIRSIANSITIISSAVLFSAWVLAKNRKV